MAKLHLITYGCQMNEYDSERVAGLLREHRWELTADETQADLILVNTCAIREKAEDKVFSKLGELRLLKAQRPDLVIGVMGCMAQLHQEGIQRRAPAVDLVFGSPAIARVAELVDDHLVRFELLSKRRPRIVPVHQLPVRRPQVGRHGGRPGGIILVA
jgi:tRNA-2-methylthio-N6-dimethylallyladenosine synthase